MMFQPCKTKLSDSKLVFEDEDGFLSSYDVKLRNKSQLYNVSSIVSSENLK